MLTNRLVGGCLAIASFAMLGIVMSSLSGGIGIQVMKGMGMPYVLAYMAAQVVIVLLFITPAERLVPAMLFAGGTIIYMFVLGDKGMGGSFTYALYAGSAFSGLAIGTLVVMGGKN